MNSQQRGVIFIDTLSNPTAAQIVPYLNDRVDLLPLVVAVHLLARLLPGLQLAEEVADASLVRHRSVH